MTEIVSSIPSRIRNAAVGGHVCGVEDIIDDNKNKTQREINTELEERINNSSDFIKLLNLTNTAPAQCVAGDKYYNTNSKKIFTATDTNTWGDTGVNPDTSRLYVNLSNSDTYRWNGTDMTPLGNPDVYNKNEVDELIATERERAQAVETMKANTSDVNTALEGKQNTINDLSTIRSGASKGATAQQPATTLAGYGITDAYTKEDVDSVIDIQNTKIGALEGHDVIVGALPASGVANKIYRVPGTTSFTDYAWNGSQFVAIATYSFPGVDDKPMHGSDRIISSGGIADILSIFGFEFVISSTWTDLLLESNGTTQASSYDVLKTSDYFPVKAGDSISGVFFNPGTGFTGLAFYTERNTESFVSSIPYTSIVDGEINTFTVPVDGYARAMLKTVSNPLLILYYHNNSDNTNIIDEEPTEFSKKLVRSGGIISYLIKIGVIKTVKILIDTTYAVGFLMADGTRIINSGAGINRVTDYFPVSVGQKICAKVADGYSDYAVIAFYTNNDGTGFVSSVNAGNITSGENTFISPVNGYAVVMTNTNVNPELKIYYLSISSGDTPTEEQSSKWKGKKIGFVGDSTSLTVSGVGYVESYRIKTEANVINYAIGATTIAGTAANCMCNRVSEFAADLDMLVILGGVNDHRNGVPLGSMSDYNVNGNANNTFYGALHTFLRGLKDKYKNVPVVFMTPLHNNYVNMDQSSPYYGDTAEYNYNQFQNGVLVENKFPLKDNFILDDSVATGGTMSDYITAIKKMCDLYSVPVIDLHAISGINPLIPSHKTLYTIDGIHPYTTAAATRICEVIYPLLEQMA